jgi:hypothetical protein
MSRDVYAHDACDGEDVSVELRSIVAHESDRITNVKADIEGAEFGIGDLEFSLRAKRSNPGAVRMYTVTYRAKDASNHSVTRRATIAVLPELPVD